jgi:hypothetical protein
VRQRQCDVTQHVVRAERLGNMMSSENRHDRYGRYAIVREPPGNYNITL